MPQRTERLDLGDAVTIATSIALIIALLVLLAPAARGQNLVRDIAPPTGIGVGSNPGGFTVAGSLAFYAANDGYGTELWRTDGTQGGTFLVADLAPGQASSSPEDFVALGPIVFFTADARGMGREPWRSDGTAAGTWPLGDLVPGGLGSSVTSPVAFAGRIYFVAHFDAHALGMLGNGLLPFFRRDRFDHVAVTGDDGRVGRRYGNRSDFGTQCLCQSRRRIQRFLREFRSIDRNKYVLIHIDSFV